MVALKDPQAKSFLRQPDSKYRAVMLYGPDAGLVSERGAALAKILAARENPPGEIIRLDDSDLETASDRLEVELLTRPMFGGTKIVRASPGRRLTTNVLKPLVEGGGLVGMLIVEGGNARPDDKMRLLFEKSPSAAAIGCYPDEAGSLDTLVSDMLDPLGKQISVEARQELIARLGADRVLSRAEIEKLLLYAHGAPCIELEHVEAIVGDAADLTIDMVIAAAASGDSARALSECDRAVSSGESAQSVILAAERYFMRLHRLRADVDAGRSIDDVMRSTRPPLPPKTRRALEGHVRSWTTAGAGAVISRVSDAVRRSRTTGANEGVIADRLLMEVARLARALAARRGAPSGRDRG
jgi:DNA polymerase-3 subunit delta